MRVSPLDVSTTCVAVGVIIIIIIVIIRIAAIIGPVLTLDQALPK